VLGRYWHDESRREANEVARLEGRRVVAVGRYRRETPPNPDVPAQAARLSTPVLLEVERVELAGPDEPPAGSGPSGDAGPQDDPLPEF
jgi:hypothetical protein